MVQYTSERHTQILISLLKEYGIKKIVVSPGNTNVTFVGSIQEDPFFDIYSCVDERSAAYMACGLSSKFGEPVALSCTGATSSRNYLPGLTEAYYRKLPILAITSTQYEYRVGNNIAQVIDRTTAPKDTLKYSISVGPIHSEEEEEFLIKDLNYAFNELFSDGQGPVHINLTTTYSRDFSVKNLPNVKLINRYLFGNELPNINANRVVIYSGAHKHFDEHLTRLIDEFCEKYNAAVFCDMTVDYQGKYRIDASLLCSQDNLKNDLLSTDLVIHIGEIGGSEIRFQTSEVWRLSEDGKYVDTFLKLKNVFKMKEHQFFEYYNNQKEKVINTDYYRMLLDQDIKIRDLLPNTPFSNIWIAQNTINKIPKNSNMYFSILNTLRSWNFCKLPTTVTGFSNTGGFGIDGGISSSIGIALADPDNILISIVGDLQFFYDMNSLGNRHIPKNFRLLIINNGVGVEFKNYNHYAANFGGDTDKYIAAQGHFGCKSKNLIKNYSENLGYEYLSASNKEEYLNVIDRFLDKKMEQPIVLEVFTDSRDESAALEMMRNIIVTYKSEGKKLLKSIVGETSVNKLKKILNK